jgi:hypothetical protein
MSDRKYYAILFGIYLISHGGILFIPNAIYWDDWTLYRVDPSVIKETFKYAGSMFNMTAYLHEALLSLGVWSYRLLTFIMMFAAAVSLDKVIKRHSFIDQETRLTLVLFFLAMPLYLARVAIIDVPYTICYFLFFVAWAIIDSNRVLALVLFFLSFNTNSLLVFYSLPMFDLYLRTVNYKWSCRSAVLFSVNKLDFVLLPFVYFLIKIKFYKPTGVYVGYNEHFSIKSLIASPVVMIFEWMTLAVPVLPVFLMTMLMYFVGLKIGFKVSKGNERGFSLLLFGSVAFLAGGFAYWVLGHVPMFSDWSSRHQLLLPLGGAFLIVGLISLISSNIRYFVAVTLLSVCLIKNMQSYIDLYFDWHKQTQLIKIMSNNEDIHNSDIVIFDDETIADNAFGRLYRSYEWNGLMSMAFQSESRLGMEPHEYTEYLAGRGFNGYFQNPHKYRIGQYILKDTPTVVRVKIKKTHKPMIVNILNMRLPDYVVEARFEDR